MGAVSAGVLFAGGLFFGVLVFLEAGRRIGLWRLWQDPDGAREGVGAVDGVVFGLLGLLIAFTFSGAASRFNDRRQLIVEEANDISTAWLRLDVLSPNAAADLRELFRHYLDSRIATYRKLPDIPAAEAELAHSMKLQNEIWQSAIVACREGGMLSSQTALLSALNTMFDIENTRTASMKLHPPILVFAMLGGLSLAASLLAGYGMAGSKSRSWLHIVCFAFVMAITVYVIVDIEYPRLGFIRVNSFDSVMVDLRASMK